jgi:hypothetical protein
MRNLEFKAPLDDPRPIIRRARELGADLWSPINYHFPSKKR